MDYKELKKAAKVLNYLSQVVSYVTKERFVMVAKTRFGIYDEHKLDVMYGLLNKINTPKMLCYITHDDDEKFQKSVRWPEYVKLVPKTIEIAESAYSLRPDDYNSNSIKSIEYMRFHKEDKRRYFYNENSEAKMLDVSLGNRADIILLSELLQHKKVELVGVAEHLGYLEGETRDNVSQCRKRFDYFEGDIYLLYGDPTDRVFYDWYSHGDDAGVYIATDTGWRKLLYTPGRGYLDKKGYLDFEDDKCFYTDHRLQWSGKGFLYVGNIHQDASVLLEKKQKNEEE